MVRNIVAPEIGWGPVQDRRSYGEGRGECVGCVGRVVGV